MRHYCTYFDVRFLSRGLALHESLQAHAGEFKLWILCMDDDSYRLLTALALPDVEAISLPGFLSDDARLGRVRSQRTKVEFYFTCTPSLPLYVLNCDPSIDLITYLDADLWFTASPEPLFTALGADSIGIISHRFPDYLNDRKIFGLYNVGLVAFRRDQRGLACLEWWRDRCIEWCHDRVEDGRYADQRYLDDWPTRFDGVCVLQHKGANLAVWNLANYELRWSDEGLTVDHEPLIFFHFHGLRWVWKSIVDLNSAFYQLRLSELAITRIFEPYIRRIIEIEAPLDPQSGRRLPTPRRTVAARLKSLCALVPNLVRRHYVVVMSNRLWWWKFGTAESTAKRGAMVSCLNAQEE